MRLSNTGLKTGTALLMLAAVFAAAGGAASSAAVAVEQQQKQGHVTGAVAPYAQRLEQARTALAAEIVLSKDQNPAVRSLMVTNIGRHGLEFSELSSTVFGILSEMTLDQDKKVAAEAVWQMGLIGDKYDFLALPALARMFSLTEHRGNTARDTNIVQFSTIIGGKGGTLSGRAFDILNSIHVDPQAEAGAHSNYVVAEAARGMGVLGAKYPELAEHALDAVARFARQSKDADIIRGVIDGASNIGMNTDSARARTYALRIISEHRKDADKNVRWWADYYAAQLGSRKAAAPATAPKP